MVRRRRESMPLISASVIPSRPSSLAAARTAATHLAFIRQSLLFVVGLAALIAVVPLAVWAGTGNPRTAWWALKRYGLMLAVVVGFMAAGALIGGIAALFTP
jgi:hypothetical protein